MTFSEFVVVQWPLFLALAIISLMLLYSIFGEKMQGYKNVNPAEAIRLMNDDVMLVDVRESHEVREGKIAEAINIPSGQIKDKMDRFGQDKDRAILFYCQSGARSGRACATLKAEGYTNLFNLGGGIMAWKAANMPVNKKGDAKKKKGRKNG